MKSLTILLFLSLFSPKSKDNLIQRFPKSGMQFKLPSEKWKKLSVDPKWRKSTEDEFDGYFLSGLRDSLNHEVEVGFQVKMEKLKTRISAIEYSKADSFMYRSSGKFRYNNFPNISSTRLKTLPKDSAIVIQYITLTEYRGDTTFCNNMYVYVVYQKTGIRFWFKTERPVWALLLPEFEKILQSLKPLHGNTKKWTRIKKS